MTVASQARSTQEGGDARVAVVPQRPFADEGGRVNPARLIVDLTRRCNLRCGFCSSRSDTPDASPELSSLVLLDLLRTAEARGAFEVTLTGGEPLAWPGLEETAAAGSPLGFTSLQIATNATLVDERRLACVAALAPRRVRISLDGPPEVHDAVRGRGAFAAALGGLRRLRSVVDRVEVVTVLQGEGAKRWGELTTGLIAEGVDVHELRSVDVAPDSVIRAPTAAEMREVAEAAAELQERSPPGFSLRVARTAPPSPRGAPPRSGPISELTGLHFRGLYVWVLPDGELLRGAPVDALRPCRQHALGNASASPLARCLDEHPLRLSDLASVATTDASWAHPAAALGSPLLSLGELARQVRDEPGRFRVRADERATLLFDTNTFILRVLSPEEAEDCGIARMPPPSSVLASSPAAVAGARAAIP